ncbi:VOC family protein [Mariniluteicoccus flavus]
MIDWLVRVLDAEEIDRMVGDDGYIAHAEVRIGDSAVMLFDKPDWPATRPSSANQQIEQPDEAEMQRRMGDTEFMNAMAYVTSAQVPLP